MQSPLNFKLKKCEVSCTLIFFRLERPMFKTTHRVLSEHQQHHFHFLLMDYASKLRISGTVVADLILSK